MNIVIFYIPLISTRIIDKMAKLLDTIKINILINILQQDNMKYKTIFVPDKYIYIYIDLYTHINYFLTVQLIIMMLFGK